MNNPGMKRPELCRLCTTGATVTATLCVNCIHHRLLAVTADPALWDNNFCGARQLGKTAPPLAERGKDEWPFGTQYKFCKGFCNDCELFEPKAEGAKQRYLDDYITITEEAGR